MSDAAPAPAATTTSSTGLPSNLAGALAYLLGPITGIAFLLLERNDRFVRFHAMQSVVVGVALVVVSIGLSILGTVLGFVPVLGIIVALLLSIVFGLGSFVLWLMLMWRAWSGAEWEVPVAGAYARKLTAA